MQDHQPVSLVVASSPPRVATKSLQALATVVVAAATTTAPAAAQSPDTSCLEWSEPVEVWKSPQEVGYLAPVEAMSVLVRDTGRSLVVASFRGALPGDTMHDLVITHPGQAPLPHPPGGRFFLGPAAHVDDDGVVHLLWGEPEAEVGAKIFDYEEVFGLRILYSRYANGSWTPPEQIAEAFGWMAYLSNRSRWTADERGTTHYVFADSGGHKLGHLRRVGGVWSVGTVPGMPRHAFPSLRVASGGIYPTLLSAGDGELILAYVSGAAEEENDRRHDNSVFLRRSSDGGQSWTDPVLVHLSNGEPAMRLELVRDRNGALHLFWVTQKYPGTALAPMAAAIVHTVSQDGGTSWSEPLSVPLPADDEGPGVIRAAAAPDGTVLLMFTSSRRPHRQLFSSTVEGEHIGEPVRVLPDTTRRTANFEFALDRDGRTHLLWTSGARYRPSDPDGIRDLRLLYATRDPCDRTRRPR